jgi:hypothetical protein
LNYGFSASEEIGYDVCHFKTGALGRPTLAL